MRFAIEATDATPIFAQLVRQVKYAVAQGVLVPGEMIPSTRELAKQLTINPNTVQRAYSQLQSEDILEVQRGRGVSVCTTAKKVCIAQRQHLLKKRLEDVVAEALHSGLERDQLSTMFDQVLEKLCR